MKLFNSMSLTEAARFYEEIRNSEISDRMKKMFLSDIWFFTDGLTKAY